MNVNFLDIRKEKDVTRTHNVKNRI